MLASSLSNQICSCFSSSAKLVTWNLVWSSLLIERLLKSRRNCSFPDMWAAKAPSHARTRNDRTVCIPLNAGISCALSACTQSLAAGCLRRVCNDASGIVQVWCGFPRPSAAAARELIQALSTVLNTALLHRCPRLGEATATAVKKI